MAQIQQTLANSKLAAGGTGIPQEMPLDKKLKFMGATNETQLGCIGASKFDKDYQVEKKKNNNTLGKRNKPEGKPGNQNPVESFGQDRKKQKVDTENQI